MSLPKKLFRLDVVPGGNPLNYRQKGGGTFASLRDMEYRMMDLDRSGVRYKVYETDTNWKEVGSNQDSSAG